MKVSVSVIMPVYNAERYLRAAIDSVVSQTFTDWELILVDDGSTDASAEICDEYAAGDSRIRVIHRANGGLSAARNTALDVAVGEWITFVDSDDMLHSQFLATLIEIQHHSGSEIVCAGAVEGAEPTFKAVGVPSLRTYKAEQATRLTLYQRHGMLNTAWSKVFARRIFDKERFTPGILYEDLDFFYRAYAQVDTVTFTRARLYFYRSTPGSLVRRWRDNRLDVLAVTERLENYMHQHNRRLVAAARDRRLSANFNMLIEAARHDRPDVTLACWQLIKKYRLRSLVNPKVRAKNRVGILLSYLGMSMFLKLSRWVGK